MAQDVLTLIDEGAKKCGGYAALARRMDVHPVALAEMRSGKRAITPETVALLGDVLELPGSEVRELAAWAVISASKNAQKREALRRGFFGALVSGAVLIGLLGGPTDATAATETTARPIHCRELVRLARAALRRLRAALCVRWIAAYH